MSVGQSNARLWEISSDCEDLLYCNIPEHHIVKVRCMLLPYFVLFVDDLVFHDACFANHVGTSINCRISRISRLYVIAMKLWRTFFVQ